MAIYATAVNCAVNEALKNEWKEYLRQTRNHVRVMRDVPETLGLDPAKETPGRGVVQHVAGGLVKAMDQRPSQLGARR